jgi:DNA-binding MarR family transcriptional regulator
MHQLMELFLKNGLKPFLMDSEFEELEKQVNRSDLMTLLVLDLRGEISMSDLAYELGAPLSTLTSIINRLLRKDYIERKRSEQDGRVLLVRLTAGGKDLVNQAKGSIDQQFKRIEQVLTPEELQQFISLALKVAKAFQSRHVEGSKPVDFTPRNITIDD